MRMLVSLTVSMINDIPTFAVREQGRDWVLQSVCSLAFKDYFVLSEHAMSAGCKYDMLISSASSVRMVLLP